MFSERFANMMGALFFLIEGNYQHGHGQISRFFPKFSEVIEIAIVDACEKYSIADSVFSEEPLPIHWYFLPRKMVERKCLAREARRRSHKLRK